MNKRKRCLDYNIKAAEKRKPYVQVCILHNNVIKDHGSVTALSSVKGAPQEKLDHLLKKRNERLAEPLESPHRMSDICKIIPETLDDIDLSKVGYHRKCYQYFTKGFERLSTSKNKGECSLSSYSPRKTESCSVLFPQHQNVYTVKSWK